jgi:hypothetical protein
MAMPEPRECWVGFDPQLKLPILVRAKKPFDANHNLEWVFMRETTCDYIKDPPSDNPNEVWP